MSLRARAKTQRRRDETRLFSPSLSLLFSCPLQPLLCFRHTNSLHDCHLLATNQVNAAPPWNPPPTNFSRSKKAWWTIRRFLNASRLLLLAASRKQRANKERTQNRGGKMARPGVPPQLLVSPGRMSVQFAALFRRGPGPRISF